MPNYKKRVLADALPTNPPLAPLTGGQPARADRVASVFAEQDRVLGHGRRIVAAGGLQGADAFQVGDDFPESGVTQVHPLAGVNRIVDRKRITLTPGHYLRAVAICVPSGMTQKLDGSIYVAAGAGGTIKFQAEYDNGSDVETVTSYIEVAPSINEYGAESEYAGASFAELTRHVVDIFPPLAPVSELAKWSEGCTVDLTIAYIGGVRCVDLAVFETPVAFASTLTAAPWPTSLYVNGAGQAPDNYPAKYPVSATNKGGDPGSGTDYAIEVARRQCLELGPFLLTASAWNEATESVASTETTAITTNSTSFIDLWRPGVTAWSENAAGWTISAGGNAPGHNTSGPLELRDCDRVVTCKVSVYAKRESNAAGTATVRAQVSGYSMTDIAIASNAWGWYETEGALQCGFGAEDPTSLLLLGKTTDTGTTLHIRYAQIQYSAPPES